MVAILPAGPLKKCRAADTAAEVDSYTRHILSLRQFTGCNSTRPEIIRFPGTITPAEFQRLLPAPVHWSMLHRAGNFPVNPAPADVPAPFTLRAAACICRKAFAAA